jgi:uncharacterized protein (DUF2147 family)
MASEIWRRWITTSLLAFLALSAFGTGPVKASRVEGNWIVRDLGLHIFRCERRVCGKIVWIKEAARRPSQCGKTIVWGLEEKGPYEWTGGSILDPDDGTTYRLTATYEADGTLRARIFKGVPMIGKTEILRRVDLRSLAGRC